MSYPIFFSIILKVNLQSALNSLKRGSIFMEQLIVKSFTYILYYIILQYNSIYIYDIYETTKFVLPTNILSVV